MGYVYSGLWFIMAAVLLTKFRKESKMVYVLSVYFAFAGIWWLTDQLVSIDMLYGSYGWVFRAVSLIAVIAAGAVYYYEKLHKTKQASLDHTCENTETEAQEV